MNENARYTSAAPYNNHARVEMLDAPRSCGAQPVGEMLVQWHVGRPRDNSPP